MKHEKIRNLSSFLVPIFAVFPVTSEAQNPTIFRADIDASEIRIDGRIDEAVWLDTIVFDQLLVINPDSLAIPAYKTEIRAFYNDEGIYVAAKNYQPTDTLVARLSARDARVRRDAFGISVDPSGRGLYGYNMRVHLGGSVSDGTILPERQMSRDWDGPWRSATQELDDGWSTEIFIPWSMMSLPAAGNEARQIGLYFERTVAHLNQTWSWPPLPNTAPQHLSAYAKFDIQGIAPKPQLIYYPYVSSSYDNLSGRTDSRAGTDLYWRPNSNTQISATINPDFGTVESDDIVVNLGAFETFFSEKRSFFLEGNEIFNAHPRAIGGQSPLTLLNTRRIGASADYDFPQDFQYTATDRNQPSDLIGAAKATGQTGSLRYGVMIAAEDDAALRGLSADNQQQTIYADGKDFLIGRLLYENTSGGGRQSIGWMGTHLSHPNTTATVNAIDMHYFSVDGLWAVDTQFLHSDVNGTSGAGMITDVAFSPGQGIKHSIASSYLDKKIELNDAGFMRRNDEVSLDYTFTISRSGFERYRTQESTIRLVNQWNTSGHPVRTGLFAEQEYTFYNNSTLALDIRYYPPRIDDRASRGNGSYKIPSRFAAEATWQSDRSRPLSLLLSAGNTQEDLQRSNIGLTAGLVWQPNDKFFFENEISYNDRNSLLVRSDPGFMTAYTANEWNFRLNANYFLTSRQQFRMSTQWSGLKAHEDKHYRIDQQRIASLNRIFTQPKVSKDFNVSRLSFQARYQWEIAPLSDLFLVYTRGSNLDPDFDGSFPTLLQEAWSERISETFVAKVRYRFGG
ncbi:MAG: DUF5916 domain-containing protein [Pseudohongiella sp.]|nr:DUF5916 domain-containing protein [Pseudohongiella sp.]